MPILNTLSERAKAFPNSFQAFALSGRNPIGNRLPRVSLRLPWAWCFWPFIDIIGCGSAIQASLIAFALHVDSGRSLPNPKLELLNSLL